MNAVDRNVRLIADYYLLIALFKPHTLLRDNRVFLELRVIMGGIVRAIVGAAAFQTRQRRARDQQRCSMNVAGFTVAARERQRQTLPKSFELMQSLRHSLARAHDAGFAPHELLHTTYKLLDVRAAIACGRLHREASWRWLGFA